MSDSYVKDIDLVNAMDNCQKQSRIRFWSVAISCIGTVVGGLIAGAVMIGNCADEEYATTNATNIASLITVNQEQTKNIDKLVESVRDLRKEIKDHIRRDYKDHYESVDGGDDK